MAERMVTSNIVYLAVFDGISSFVNGVLNYSEPCAIAMPCPVFPVKQTNVLN